MGRNLLSHDMETLVEVVEMVEWDGTAVVEVGCDVVTLGTGWSYKYLCSILLSIRRYLDI